MNYETLGNTPPLLRYATLRLATRVASPDEGFGADHLPAAMNLARASTANPAEVADAIRLIPADQEEVSELAQQWAAAEFSDDATDTFLLRVDTSFFHTNARLQTLVQAHSLAPENLTDERPPWLEFGLPWFAWRQLNRLAFRPDALQSIEFVETASRTSPYHRWEEDILDVLSADAGQIGTEDEEDTASTIRWIGALDRTWMALAAMNLAHRYTHEDRSEFTAHTDREKAATHRVGATIHDHVLYDLAGSAVSDMQAVPRWLSTTGAGRG